MNKFAKISLVTSLALAGLSSSAMAADTLAEAFSNGKLKGALKSYYFAQTFEGAGKNDSSIWANGGSLNFVTDSFNGVVLGATLQTSHVADKDDLDGKTKTSMDAQGSVLSESYLQYTLNNTAFKGGRQFVSTPLVAGSGSRLIKEAFEAYLVKNTDISNTTILAGKITKYQGRTDFVGQSPYTTAGSSNGGAGEFEKIGTDGIDTIYVKNTSIPNLAVQAQYAKVDNALDNFYADATYKIDGDLKPFIAVQYHGTDYETAATKDSDLMGIKAGLTVSGLNLFAAYTTTDDDGSVNRGLGQGAYKTFTSTTKTAGGSSYTAGTDSWQIGAAYKFGALSTKLRYSQFDLPTAGADLDETTLNLGYKFSGALKNLSASVDFSVLDYETDASDSTDLRTRLIYTF